MIGMGTNKIDTERRDAEEIQRKVIASGPGVYFFDMPRVVAWERVFIHVWMGSANGGTLLFEEGDPVDGPGFLEYIKGWRFVGMVPIGIRAYAPEHLPEPVIKRAGDLP